MKKGLIKSLSIGIGFFLIDLIMFLIFISIDFSGWNLIYLGLAIFLEIGIIGAIIVYEVIKIGRKEK